MRRVNVFSSEISYDADDPPGYGAGVTRVSTALGASETSLNVFEIPAGERLCPYHYEYVEEWLLVLDGKVVVRVPDGEEELERGDVVCFPAGPEGAHRVANRSDQPARIVMFSSSREPAVAVYPDSDKVGVWTPNEEDHWMFRRADGSVGYYDGEV
jgi:uncharacterized cupin superfamily protein